MGRKGPPPPVATGEASLLHYFSSSPSVRTDSASVGSSSPARAGPSRAISLPHGNASSSSLGRSKTASASTPRAPLRATQSLGSLEAAMRDARPPPPVVASTSFFSGAPPRVPHSLGTNGARRSPRLRLTPTAEESEDDYRPPRDLVKAESLTPRRNPLRVAARTSPAPSPVSAAFPAPRSPRDPESERKGKARAMDSTSDADLALHVKKEKRGSVDPLNLCTPSPAKRARQRPPKRIFSFTVDEKGRDVLDLTLSSPSATSMATLSSDSDSEVIVVRSRRSSRAQPTTSKQPASPTRRIKEESTPSRSRSSAASRSPQKTLRRTQAIAEALQAISSPSGSLASPMQKTGDPGAPTAVFGGSRAGSATPTRAGLGIHARTMVEPFAPFTPTKSARTAASTPSISVTLASISPPQFGEQERIVSEPSTSSRSQAAAAPTSTTALGICNHQASGSEGMKGPHLAEQFAADRLVSPAEVRTPTAHSPAKSPAKLTNSAVRRLSAGNPAATGTSESIFVRSPSGSPLSSLAPTPVRQGSGPDNRPQASPSRRHVPIKRMSSFELLIDMPRTTSMSEKPKLDRGGSGNTANAARPKSSPSSLPTIAKKGDKDRSEWDALMDAESDADEADGEASEGENSPSPVKTRKAARTGGKRGSRAAASSSSEADSSSDDDELATFLSRARARREAGETLAPTSATSPAAATVPTTVSPPSPGTSMRRSSRARRETDHYTPGGSSKPAAPSARPAANGSKKALPSLFIGQQELRDGRDTFNKMMRARQNEQETGHTTAWYDKWKRVLQGDAEGMSDDDEKPPREGAPHEVLALAQVQPGDAAGLAAVLAAGSDDELEPPKAIQAAAKSKAEAAGKLIDEERAREVAQLDGAVEAFTERQERTVWRVAQPHIRSLETLSATMEGEGWLGRMASLLKAGLRDSDAMPSPVTLFSAFSGADHGADQDRKMLTDWLCQLVCHPSTPSKLVYKLQAWLARLVRPIGGAQHVAFERVSALLEAVGLKAERDGVQDQETSAAAIDAGATANADGSVLINQVRRNRVVLRWCGLMHALLSAAPRSLVVDDTVKLAELVVRLALDPTSSPLRSSLGDLLVSVLATIHKSPSAGGQLYAQLARRYRDAKPRVQFAVLQALPHASEQDKQLRRWLACALLAPVEQFEEVVLLRDLSEPVLPQIRNMLGSPAADNVFVPKANAGPDEVVDGMLVDRARILMLSLASISYEIYDCEDRSELRHDLDAIISHIRKIDSRFRADARKGLAVERLLAKNLFTALVHSLTYQLRAARGQRAGSDLTEEAARAFAAEDRAAKAQEPAQDPKQPKLSFGRTPKTEHRLASLSARVTATAAKDDEDMVSDVSDDDDLLR